MVSTTFAGYLANALGAQTNPYIYGPLITGCVTASYLGSIPFWWKAGKEYKDFKIKQE
jgi:hypothetical protein